MGERAASALELKMGNRQAGCIGNGGKDLRKKGGRRVLFGAMAGYLWGSFMIGLYDGGQIDIVKNVVSKFREAEIDHLSLPDSDREEMKRQWKLWLDATTRGIKDELRGEGKLM